MQDDDAPMSARHAGGADQEARDAATRAGVRVEAVDDMEGLRAVAALFERVWGSSEEGVPIGSETLKGLAHAGGCTLVARGEDGGLVGAASLALAEPSMQTYGLIAAVAPDCADRGVGLALKLAQRWWALERGLTSMAWTFDPLVARNARFNLVKLGAVAPDYEVAFYGQMSDAVNGADEADRLVAHWDLRPDRPARAVGADLEPAADAEPAATGPDDAPAVLRDPAGLWVRVPRDVVQLRREAPELASAWRVTVREHLGGALAAGGRAVHLSRSGWYLVTGAGA